MSDTQLFLPLAGDDGIRLRATDLARELGQPPPTPEQAAVIEAPLEPCVVVAGAGSGKTETMATRVVWLVANELVRPEQVLGLTFTRKAARELAARIRRRLGQLRARGFLDPAGSESQGDVTVATYDAYAQRVVAEHALRRGREPSPRLLTEAMAWQYADRVVRAYDGPMDGIDRALATVTRDVLDLAGELSGHLVTPRMLQAYTDELLAAIEAKPAAKGQRTRQAVYAPVRKALELQRSRARLLPIVEAFAAEKRRREVVDFADQAELAARLAEEFPEVGARERERFPVVLLDEYQDTSHAQLVLLRGLFGVDGHPVTAVGDPCQSIYGWRGASARTLESFGGHFTTGTGEPARTRTLTTSFRNGAAILEVANVLSRPLRAAGLRVPELSAYEGNGVGTVTAALHLTVDDEANAIADEAARRWHEPERADRRKRARSAGPRDGCRDGPGDSTGSGTGSGSGNGSGGTAAAVERPTIAVLVRQRAQLDRIAHALRVRGLPVEVVGVGGLLTSPPVADVVATLQVLADPSRGDALMRLLTGARWRIGPRDLDGLGRWARRLATRAYASDNRTVQTPAPAEASGAPGIPEIPETPAPERLDDASIVDALDALDDAPPTGYFSPEGRRRLRALGDELRSLRRRAGQSLVDLVVDVVRALRLEVEVAARTGDIVTSRADLDAFLDVTVDFAESGESPTLTGFLAYLDAAADSERGLEAGKVEVSEDRVQLLTVHGAKGLEWDVVFVPGLMSGVFPSKPKSSGAWLTTLGDLPFGLRGDAEALPRWEYARAEDQQAVDGARKEFLEACDAWAQREERRLAYVAVTRARKHLVVSGHRWADGKQARGIGPFLAEIAEVCRAAADAGRPGLEVTDWHEEIDLDAGNPLTAVPTSHAWPYDPLDADRRAQLEHGADLVRAARAALEPDREPDLEPDRGPDLEPDHPGLEPETKPETETEPEPDLEPGRPQREAPDRADVLAAAAEWDADIELLLAERARRTTDRRLQVDLPGHVSVSQLVQLRRDPAALARAIRRPLPRPPNPFARRGTAFHAWLESRFGTPRLLDVDELPGAVDDAGPDDELAALQEAFLASEWADRQPSDVEVSFELVVAGTVVRGRADAVFPHRPHEPEHAGIEVVDWKTGRPPSDPEDEAARAVQLAAYRLAWSEMTGRPLDRVHAAFHYVRLGRTDRPVDLLDREGLEALIRSIPTATPANR